jgi:hypothetical protein
MTPISEAVKQIIANPAAVIAIDTCSLIDLFRVGEKRRLKAPPDEIGAVVRLLQQLATRPEVPHLIVPELIPKEFTDNADKEQAAFRSWFG